LVAGIASVLVTGGGGVAGGGSAAGGGGGGGSAAGGGGGGGAASGVAWAQALPALRIPVSESVKAHPSFLELERGPIILFPPSCLNFEGDHIERVLTQDFLVARVWLIRSSMIPK